MNWTGARCWGKVGCRMPDKGAAGNTAARDQNRAARLHSPSKNIVLLQTKKMRKSPRRNLAATKSTNLIQSESNDTIMKVAFQFGATW